MNQLTVKAVPFMGSDLMAAKDEKTGKIYAGIKWMCDGIGLSQGQAKAERLRIQEDLVLKQGGRNLILPTKGGNQEVQCIDNEFVPIWLAKIPITPTMQKDHSKVADKLIKYQLKAQKVLADAFLHNKTSKAEKPTDKKLSLASFNHLLEINIRQMKAAEEPATHIAAWTNGLTREVLSPFGISVPALPDAVPNTYDATEMAKKLGVYSKNGNPHPQPITAIIKEIGIAPGETFTTETTAHLGKKDVPDVRYAESVFTRVQNWLEEHGKPDPIALGKNYNVIYKN